VGIASKVCPKCGTSNNPEFLECWKCKTALKDAKVIQIEEADSVNDIAGLNTTGNGIVKCSSCKMLTPIDLGKCRTCGCGLGEVGASKFEWSDFARKLFTTIILVLVINYSLSLWKDFIKENITVERYIEKVRQEVRTDGIYKALTRRYKLQISTVQ